MDHSPEIINRFFQRMLGCNVSMFIVITLNEKKTKYEYLFEDHLFFIISSLNLTQFFVVRTIGNL